jgi:hypothetical protein
MHANYGQAKPESMPGQALFHPASIFHKASLQAKLSLFPGNPAAPCRYFSVEELQQFAAKAREKGAKSDNLSVLDSIFGPTTEHGQLIRCVLLAIQARHPCRMSGVCSLLSQQGIYDRGGLRDIVCCSIE